MKKLMRIAASVIALATLATGSMRIDAKSACDRTCLTGFADTYFKALVDKRASDVPLAPNVKVTLNGQTMKLDQAFWDGAQRIVYRWDIVNEQLGDLASEAVVLNADASKTMDFYDEYFAVLDVTAMDWTLRRPRALAFLSRKR